MEIQIVHPKKDGEQLHKKETLNLVNMLWSAGVQFGSQVSLLRWYPHSGCKTRRDQGDSWWQKKNTDLGNLGGDLKYTHTLWATNITLENHHIFIE